MKKFLSNLFKYLCFIFFVQSLTLIIYFNVDFKISKILNKNIQISRSHIYILGNSHPECAINDSILPVKFINIAKSSEPLFYTCSKARYILKRCLNDTIIIEFTNISSLTTDWVIGDESFLRNFKIHAERIDYNQHKILLYSNPIKYFKSLASISISDFSKKNLIEGGYYKLYRENANKKIFNNNYRWFPPKDKSLSHDEERLNYLELVRLVKDFPHTQFYFIRSPMHRNFEFFDEFNFQKKVQQLVSFKNAHFFDFAYVLNSDEFYADVEHLNYKGANAFTKIFLKSFISNTSKKILAVNSK